MSLIAIGLTGRRCMMCTPHLPKKFISVVLSNVQEIEHTDDELTHARMNMS